MTDVFPRKVIHMGYITRRNNEFLVGDVQLGFQVVLIYFYLQEEIKSFLPDTKLENYNIPEMVYSNFTQRLEFTNRIEKLKITVI